MKLSVYRSTTDDGASGATVTGRATLATFPAGTALALLGVWFVLSRILVPFTVRHAAAGRVAMLAGSAGAVLAAVAVVTTALEGRHERGGALAIARAVLALPVAALVASALHYTEPPLALQWAGLAGALGSVVVALALAVFHARRGMFAAGGALLALLVGETIEFVWAPVAVMAPHGSRWLALLARLGPLAELCAVFGAALAVLWAARAGVRTAGAARMRMFAPLPLFVAVVLSMLTASIPGHVAGAVARSAFGVRFDLFLAPDRPTVLTLPVLLLYLLVPELLLGAAALSMAGVTLDRGASIRRALGWLAVLLAGFAALRMAGPMDPIRLITVTLGAMLLERAAALEAADRGAPA